MPALSPTLKHWSDDGRKAHVVDATVSALGITITTFTAHVQLLKEGPSDMVRTIIFESPHMGRIADEKEPWSKDEQALAFLGIDSNDANDLEFARSMGGKVGVLGKFYRDGDELIVLCYSEKLGKTYYISIFLDEVLKFRLKHFLRS